MRELRIGRTDASRANEVYGFCKIRNMYLNLQGRSLFYANQ
ncbi:hypothetical protein HMPREF3293_01901 [Christensenella minuta]|uniref:Uncharacterized protein n=1 Tax=Christensenella minuta TaxID=626937 RepID=A0A136Q3R9_9FIRM|nr:hypothetical protein HMPREF3293_01901 [Christensenella minuta]